MNHSEELLHEAVMGNAVAQLEMALVAALRPRIFIDGNQWCVLYGENLQEGVCGFGDTAMLAVYNFNRAWHKPVSVAA